MAIDNLEKFKSERTKKELATLLGVSSIALATAGAYMRNPYLKYPGMVGAFLSGLARGAYKKREEHAFNEGFIRKLKQGSMLKSAAPIPTELMHIDPALLKTIGMYGVGIPAIYKMVRYWNKQLFGSALKETLGKKLSKAEKVSLAVAKMLQRIRGKAKGIKTPALRAPADWLTEYATVITDPQDIIRGAEKYIKMTHGVAPKETQHLISYIQSGKLFGKTDVLDKAKMPFLRDMVRYRRAAREVEGLVGTGTKGKVRGTARKTYDKYLSPGKIEGTVSRLVKTKENILDVATRGIQATPTFAAASIGAIVGSQIGYVAEKNPQYEQDPLTRPFMKLVKK